MSNLNPLAPPIHPSDLVNDPASDPIIQRMAQRLSARLAPSQDGVDRSLRWNMTPELAYGRHRGPARLNSRQAAVAVALFYDPQRGWLCPLTRRPHTLRHHGGQICFPGGQIERGETPADAALREFEEELGLPADVVRICGQLPRQYVYASDNDVTPVVCVLRRPETAWKPDPGEVDEVLQVPLASIRDDAKITGLWQQRAVQATANLSQEIAQVSFRCPAFRFRGQPIWGATAVILDQLAQCLRREDFDVPEPARLPVWPSPVSGASCSASNPVVWTEATGTRTSTR